MTFRVGGSWGVTIVREGAGEADEDGRRPGDELVAVVVNGDRDLAAAIVDALNSSAHVYRADARQPFRPLPWRAREGERDEDLPPDTTRREGPRCLHAGPGSAGDRCTLPPHHTGFHRAGDGVVVIAEWAS